MIHGNLADLERLLRVRPDGPGSFLAGQVPEGRSRVYGGQFFGQGLMAAAAAAASGEAGAAANGALPVRSFHAYFLRPGSTDRPTRYEVRRHSPGLFEVRASQNGKLQYLMDAAFGAYAGAPAAQIPRVPAPESCIPRADGIAKLDTRNTDASWATVDAPFEYRFVEHIWSDEYRAPRHHVWFRARQPTGTWDRSTVTTQAALAYFADDNIMDNALFPTGWVSSWTQMVTASLDHAMWFHRQPSLDDWLLFAQDSPVAGGGRGFTRGRIFDRAGRLVASACQEILMRPAGTPG